MAKYDAFESDGEVSVCAVLNAEALERRIIVQLSSQDSTAQSKIFKVYTFCVSVQYIYNEFNLKMAKPSWLANISTDSL